VRSGFESQAGYLSPGVRFPGGARGSDGNRKTSRAQTSRSVRSNRTFRTPYPLAQPAAALGSEPRGSWFESREGSFAAAHGLRLRLRTADGPVRPRVAALRPRSPTAGGTRMRVWVVRVRVAPRTLAPGSNDRAPLVRPALEAGARWFESSSRNDALRIGVRSSLVWTCRPGRHRGRAHAVVAQQVRARRCQRRGRRFEAGQPLACLSRPTGRSHGVQTAGSAGSNPAGGTWEGEPAGRPGLAANECVSVAGMGFDCSAFRSGG
jgi:hypothetical protein